jgi:cytochrome subunit of sulfide dehydrogenase
MRVRLTILLFLSSLLAACGADREPPQPPSADAPAIADAERPSEQATVEQEPLVALAPPEIADICLSCHGETAPSPFSDMPTVQGLPADAIENALFDFRAGTRPCRQSRCSRAGTCPDLDMCTVTNALADEDIAALAQWYASLPFVPADQSFSGDLAPLGRQIHDARCESCHTEGGTTPIDQANRLRGQHKEYLRLALHQYRSGERMAVGMMDTSVKALTEDEIAALLEFYASPADEG